MNRILALMLFLLSAPIWPIFYIVVKFDSKGPFIFKQKRAGRNMRPFTMYKIRTMVEGAEKLKSKYLNMNEADGPVFKIRNDPRFTRVGKILARTALDELPQLWNVICGEMALVGPRPLPILEANKIPKKFKRRFEILPGMTSIWVIKGGHALTFDQWMRLDLEYVKNKSFWYDMQTFAKTIFILIRI